jgi:DUF4097 and DUF4098 domain-containing protein YvlB
VVLGAVILVLTLVGLGYYHLNLSNYVHWGNTPVSKTINLPRQTLQVIAVPQLVVKNFAGILIIHTGDSNIVRISAAEQISGSSSPDDIQYTVTQNRNTVEVEAQKNGTFSTGNLSVDLDITLPSQSIIQATLGAGNISIDGISGLISVQTGSGNVDFKNGTVQKNTSFQANAGSITFSGKLAPNGNYEFKGNTGSIDITLPANSAFILDASTQVGNVSNAFRSILVGHNPTSQLHVHVDVGSISIHQGQSGGATEQSSCQRC